MNFHFVYIPKAQIDGLLPTLFAILYGNMNLIAPTGYSYEEDYESYYANVLPALMKEQRKIVLLFSDGNIVGFFQYYTRDDLFMMEEIQVKKEYHGTGIFEALYTWLVSILPKTIQTVEAYSHKNNIKSQGILEHLGLKKCGFNKDGVAYHYKGDYANLLKRYQK